MHCGREDERSNFGGDNWIELHVLFLDEVAVSAGDVETDEKFEYVNLGEEGELESWMLGVEVFEGLGRGKSVNSGYV